LTPQKAQEIQDEIFRTMPMEKKMELVESFLDLARKLNPSYFETLTESELEKLKIEGLESFSKQKS
jgi:hypothetical protein